MTILLIILAAISFLVVVWLVTREVAKVVLSVQKSASETVVETVTASMAAIFGKQDEAVMQLPGNEEIPEPNVPWYPAHEYDDEFMPGSVAEIRGTEAGWAPNRTDRPTSDG